MRQPFGFLRYSPPHLGGGADSPLPTEAWQGWLGYSGALLSSLLVFLELLW